MNRLDLYFQKMGVNPNFDPDLGWLWGFFTLILFIFYLSWVEPLLSIIYLSWLIHQMNRLDMHFQNMGVNPNFDPNLGWIWGGFMLIFGNFHLSWCSQFTKTSFYTLPLGRTPTPTLKDWKRTFPLHFGCNLNPMDTGWASSMGITLTRSEQEQKLVSFMSRLI